MDKSKSTKLTGLIAKLTVAANKAVKKSEISQKTQKHYSKTDVNVPFNVNHLDRNLRTAKLLK
jgi:hypothetical protein